MRRFFQTVSIVLLCGILSCPVAEGRGRNNASQGGGAPAQQAPSPQQGGQRPGGGNSGGGGYGGQRPGNNHGNRPHSGNIGPSHGGGYDGPGYNPPPGPGAPPPPPGGGHCSPGYGHHPNYGCGAPHRPNLPPPAPWHRPSPPPPGYHYYSGPQISTILGVALGATIYYTLDNLYSRGYNITGYGDNAVYLSNVLQLGLNWPDATLYYEYGQLAASEFVYSQPYYDMSRYYNVYGLLSNTYGYPSSTGTYGQGGSQATWWSPTGQFITLTYSPAYSYGGSTRYYTTLSFGN